MDSNLKKKLIDVPFPSYIYLRKKSGFSNVLWRQHTTLVKIDAELLVFTSVEIAQLNWDSFLTKTCTRFGRMNRAVFNWFLGFHQSVIKTKKRNHSVNKVKNLRHDRRLIYQQPHQEWGQTLCCFSFARYLHKCVTQIYRVLYGDAIFVPFVGAQTWRP